MPDDSADRDRLGRVVLRNAADESEEQESPQESGSCSREHRPEPMPMLDSAQPMIERGGENTIKQYLCKEFGSEGDQGNNVPDDKDD